MSNAFAMLSCVALLFAAVLCGCRCVPEGTAPDGALVDIPGSGGGDAETSAKVWATEAACNLFATELTAVALESVEGDFAVEVRCGAAGRAMTETLFRALRGVTGARSVVGSSARYRLDSVWAPSPGEAGAGVWLVTLSRASDGKTLYRKTLSIAPEK